MKYYLVAEIEMTNQDWVRIYVRNVTRVNDDGLSERRRLSGQSLRVAAQLVGQKLHGYGTMQPRALSFAENTHPAATLSENGWTNLRPDSIVM